MSVVKAGMKGPALLVSLAPKVTLAALSTDSGTLRVARMIPNAPSCIGQGYNPVAFGPGLDSAARAELAALVAPWGQAPEVEEVELEAGGAAVLPYGLVVVAVVAMALAGFYGATIIERATAAKAR